MPVTVRSTVNKMHFLPSKSFQCSGGGKSVNRQLQNRFPAATRVFYGAHRKGVREAF